MESKLYRTEPDVQVLMQSQRPSGEQVGEIILAHGLEGSGQSGYMLSLSQAGLGGGLRHAPFPHADLRVALRICVPPFITPG